MSVRLGSQVIDLPQSVRTARPGLAAYANQKVVVGLRPEHLPAVGNGAAGVCLAGMVDLIEALGSELMVHFTIDARRVQAEGTSSADQDAVTAAGEGVARVDPASPVKVGQVATFAIKADGIQFFDAATGKAIWEAD